jgi:hypothetical protein
MFNPDRPPHLQVLLKDLAAKDLRENRERNGQHRFQRRCMALIHVGQITLGFILFVGGTGLLVGYHVARSRPYIQPMVDALHAHFEGPTLGYAAFLGLAAAKLLVGLKLASAGTH